MNKNSSIKKDTPGAIEQKLECLALNEDFRKDILTFRKKWKIPTKSGLKNNKLEVWQRWLNKTSDEYIKGKRFF